MITNFYTLFHLSKELNVELAGSAIGEIFTQHRDELIISFHKNNYAILIGCEPGANYIYLRRNFTRTRKNSLTLFKKISGTEIDGISMHAFDRQISVHLKDSRKLVIRLFGSKANVLLLDEHNIRIESFLQKSDSKSDEAESAPEDLRADIPEQIEDIPAAFSDQSIKIALKHMYPRFGSILFQELLIRSGLSGDEQVKNVSKPKIDILKNEERELTKELLSSPSPRIYFDGPLPVRFSIIPLKQCGEFIYQEFGSISEGIQMFLSGIRREKETIKEKSDILKVLNRERESAERTLKNISAEIDTPEQIALYEKFGKLLMAQLHLFKKGDSIANVEDFNDNPGNIIEIPLDVHLTAAKNAERYFQKAEKAKHQYEEQNRRVAETTRKLRSISQLLEKITDVATKDDLEKFIGENQKLLSQFGLISKKPGHVSKEKPLPFRVFIVAGGFQVWAGKSGENNDLLSTRHTAKNDLWFHARGVGGSHVVLKIGTGKGEVSKHAIEQAAGIAAYYSKMRKSKLVPVTMCEGKYVRKPKGVPPGTVIVEKEKTIFAEPALPQEKQS